MKFWKELEQAGQLDQLVEDSKSTPVIIFKHSTRCSISQTALNRLERSWEVKPEEGVKMVYLDLLCHRDISNLIAEKFGVVHESPQLLLVQNGQCTFSRTHLAIRLEEVFDFLSAKN
jgi:bacillithiol system protein YtxJ